MSRTYWKPSRLIFLGTALLTYLLLHNYYRVDYIDDSWSLSWAYNWWTHGEVYDRVFGYMRGDGGSSLFSRTYVFIYGAFCSLFGWTRGGAYLLSALLVLLSSLGWFSIWKELGFSEDESMDYLLIMLLFDPYYGVAHKTRFEPLTLLFATLSLLLFLKKRYFFSGLLLLVAFETHPMGISALFYILAYLFVIRKDMAADPSFYTRGAIRFIMGCLLGIGYYLLLHLPYLDQLGDLGGRQTGHAAVSYFFTNRMAWRHWPELLLVSGSLIVFFFKGKGFERPILPAMMIGSLAVSLLLHRGNVHYMVYLYPPFLMAIVSLFEDVKLGPLLLIGFLLYQIPQYGYLYYSQREYDHKTHMADLKKALPADEYGDLFIYGTFNGWFALMDRDYRCYGWFDRSGHKAEGLEDRFILMENRLYREQYREELEDLIREREEKTGKTYRVTELGRIPFLEGDPVILYEYLRAP